MNPESFFKKVIKNFEPKLEEEQEIKQEEPSKPRYVPAPKTESELLDLLRRTPETVLSKKQRKIIASAMTFQTTKVGEVMLEKPAMTFVKETEFLGPLTLDKLYKSGFSRFPVVDGTGKIIGTLSIDNLTSLAIREAERASKYLDPNVYYVREDYSLEQAFAAFLRTNSYLTIVVNKTNTVVGLLTLDMLVSFLLGKTPHDDFSKDSDRLAVVHRYL